jgi:hypothetical protein
MKISCNIIADLLELYADGVVSEDTRKLVETHLNDCPACRERFAGIKQNVVIPAETTATPIKKIGRKLKKRFIAYTCIAAVLLLVLLFVEVRKFQIDNTPMLPTNTIAFDKIKIDSIEECEERGLRILFANRGAQTSTHVFICSEENRFEYHICFHGSRRSRQVAHEFPEIMKTIERYDSVAIYYCADELGVYWGGERCERTDTHLIWEK